MVTVQAIYVSKAISYTLLGGKVAPIFFNTMEDSGALPIECDVTQMKMGDVIHIYPYAGRVEDERGEVIARFELREVLLDEVRAGGGGVAVDGHRVVLGRGGPMWPQNGRTGPV